MAIAADDDHAPGLGATEEFHEAGAFFGKVFPLLRTVLGRDQLNAGNHHPDFRRLAQAALEPGPLPFAEHGRTLVGVWDGNLGVGWIFFQWRSKHPGIQKNELNSPARRPKRHAVVNAGRDAQRRSGRHLEEVAKLLLRRRRPGETGTPVVGAVIVIVPGGEQRRGLAELGEARHRREQGVFLAEHGRVGGIAVDVVAAEDKGIAAGGIDGVPDGLGPVLPGAGTESERGDEQFRPGRDPVRRGRAKRDLFGDGIRTVRPGQQVQDQDGGENPDRWFHKTEICTAEAG